MVRDYVKISNQDLELAEEFFDNDKHFNEWLVNVVRYYRGQNVQIKTKIVQRYFNNYKKTMDFILNAVKTGKSGGLKSAENKEVNNATLHRGVEDTLIDTPQPNSKVVSSKEKIEKNKTINNKPDADFEKPKSDYQLFMSEYDNFFKTKVGVPAKINGAEGSAMKQIVDYVVSVSKVKNSVPIDSWKFILDNFEKWEQFHQSQLKLTQINSNLPNILNSIKNGTPKSNRSTNSQSEQLADFAAKLRNASTAPTD